MAKTLDVYLRDSLVGRLFQDSNGRIAFEYVQEWLEGAGATPLSQSLPLRKQRFRTKECQGYFGGILPEENKREIIARNLGVSALNDYAMLERIGGECAGAVTFVASGQPLPGGAYGYRTLRAAELAAILRELPTRPLLAGEEGIRLSLAGAQDKVALRIEGAEISLPIGGAPSTHILKPAMERLPGVICNESLCMRLAAACGLPTAKVETRNTLGVDYLVVERYDRTHGSSPDGTPRIERLHQEDFCQAQGIVSKMKYQKEGGPSLKQCFSLLRAVSSAPAIDLPRLLDGVIYNFLIGNNDAHGKNFSLLYQGGGTEEQLVRLAPFYDLISTISYAELSRDMAMKIGAEYSSDNVSPKDFELMAVEAGLAKPLVKRRVPELADKLIGALGSMPIDDPVTRAVAVLIHTRCDRIRDRFLH